MKFRVGSMFAGVGGICTAYKNAGFDVVWANEIDKNACKTYQLNIPTVNLIQSDIYKIKEEDLSPIDIIVGGFPCQPFSLAGNQKGLLDNRGNLFFEIVRVAKYHKPQVVMLENVKNLLSVNNGLDFATIIKSLEDIGYKVKYDVLSSNEHGNIPQSRERLFIVGFLSDIAFNKFSFPSKIPLTVNLNDIIDRNTKHSDKYYYTQSSQYYQQLTKEITDDAIYQLRRVYVRKNKNNLCPTLTANMGGGGHNVPLIKDCFGIRKLIPKECFRLQGFPINWKINVSDTHAYKQAGNSVTIPVVKRIATNIMEAIK